MIVLRFWKLKTTYYPFLVFFLYWTKLSQGAPKRMSDCLGQVEIQFGQVNL